VGPVRRENFIAKMKRESGAPISWSCSFRRLPEARFAASCLILTTMKSSLPVLRSRAGLLAVSLALGSTFSSAFGAPAPVRLEPLTTSATRTPAAPETLGSVVDVISTENLARRQISSLAAALGGAPGSPLFTSGARGGLTSLFLRGANSNQALFVVDGIRINDPNTDYGVFLGGACVSACDSLEVAHGPQGTLYGGEAVGGVILLHSQRGEGAPSGRVVLEGGSFGTWQGSVSSQGQRGPSAWNFALQGGHTDNARANNGFDSTNLTLRLDGTLDERVAVGTTLRWFHGAYGSPGTRFTNDPDNVEGEDNVLVTTFAELTFRPHWTARVSLGGQDRRYTAVSPRAGRSTDYTLVRNRRAVIDGQATYTRFERHRVTAGVMAEVAHTRNTGFGSINKQQRLGAMFAQDEWSPREDLFLTAGLRNDDFDTFGRATTGRLTAAWLARPALKVRASFGTAFRSPSFLDLYGQSAFYVGNPNLRPERARGWDAGLDYYLAAGRGTISATWFDTALTNLIASTPNFRSVENIQRARTRGLEFSTQVTLPSAVEARVGFTYLEADNLTSGRRLLRRPRQSASLDLLREFGGGVLAGVGVTVAAHRRDVHAQTFAQIDAEDYSVVRLHATWQVSPRLAVKARIENLLDERYEEVNGYPALGAAAFGGVEWKF
jgi:vitamin B12 transporter